MKTLPRIHGTLLASALAFLGSALPAAALQEQNPEERLQSARERWQTLSSEEKATLRRRYEGFRRLDEDARRDLHDRASRLGRIREPWSHRLPDELRERLHGLDPAARREAMRSYLTERTADRGRRIRDKLPPDLRRKLEQAPPEEREEILKSFHREHRRAESGRMLAELRERMDLSPEEVRRLESLPIDERVASMMELRRRFLLDMVERRGPPPFLEKSDWEAWKLLPTDQFFEQWHRRGGASGPRGGSSTGSESSERWDAVREAMRPRPSWMRELAELPPTERRAEIHRRVRPRVLNALRRAGVPEDELERMNGLDPESFRAQVHRTITAVDEGARRPPRRTPGHMPGRVEGRKSFPRSEGRQRRDRRDT